jgi:hypothetical protein
MRRSHLVLTAVGIAAAAVTGSAFTAANTVPNTVAGYGEGQVTGATVTDIDYTPYASDNTDLGTVVFQSSTNVTGKTATLTLKMGTTPVGSSPYSCTLGAYAAGTMDITCDTSADHPDFDSFDHVGLTIVD